ncbi:pilus assembly protein [Xylanimonas allomyrinae]|uniref:Pilus assembly protein n=1 Tax=Xylanimonas allomyrinae TaxID=2509459 RepID=A0A4V0YEA5_9MICO|nr:pilus assembly protein [Xylanimonas allomyrinae]QAY63531.1 pilus assembly protein [Xylanimonas allomyrinae]
MTIPSQLRDDERGSVSAWAVLAAVGMVLLVGLVVDLGGQLTVQQHARAVAAQAARAGSERLDAPQAILGRSASVDVGAAKAAARGYLEAAGVSGTVTVRDGTTVTVAVSDTYDTVFLAVIGIGRLDVTGTASARVIRTFGGVER